MADSVLPEPVFPPAIAMVSTDQLGAPGETLQQRCQTPIHPLQAGPLAPSTLLSTAALSMAIVALAVPTIVTMSIVAVACYV